MTSKCEHILNKLADVATAVVVAVLFIALCSIMFGCKSVQTVEQVRWKDSTVVSYRYDTTHIIIQDTLRVSASVDSEKESDTEIVFGDGGGSYNVQTGQADGVRSVRTSQKEKEQAQVIAEQSQTINAYKAENDSLKLAIEDYAKESEQKTNTADIRPKTSGWHRFLVWWFGCSVIVLLASAIWYGWKWYRRFTIGV